MPQSVKARGVPLFEFLWVSVSRWQALLQNAGSVAFWNHPPTTEMSNSCPVIYPDLIFED
jgi:hypothetical protein